MTGGAGDDANMALPELRAVARPARLRHAREGYVSAQEVLAGFTLRRGVCGVRGVFDLGYFSIRDSCSHRFTATRALGSEGVREPRRPRGRPLRHRGFGTIKPPE